MTDRIKVPRPRRDVTLPARDVVAGLWPGTPVRLFFRDPEAEVDGICITSGTVGVRHGGVSSLFEIGDGDEYDLPLGDVHLRFNDSMNLGISGLSSRVSTRCGRTGQRWWEACDYAHEAGVPRAIHGSVGLPVGRISAYLARTDELATLLGWPTGPEQPVYQWTERTPGVWELWHPTGEPMNRWGVPGVPNAEVHCEELVGVTGVLETLAACLEGSRC